MKSIHLILGLTMFSLANLVSAQTLYWDGGTVNITTNGDGMSEGASGSWDNSTVNWDQGAGVPETAWVSGTNAFFGATGIAPNAGTVTLNAAINANIVTINTTNYTFTDGGNTANTLTVNTITNNQNSSMSNNIVNSSTFTKSGGGNLTLTAASSGLTGNINVNGGTLIFGNNSTTGPLSFGDVTVATNATLQLNPVVSETYAQTISGQGSLSVHGSNYTTQVTVAGNNTFTGNVTVNQANLIFTSASDTSASALGMGTNLTIGLGGSATYLQYAGYGDTTARTITLSANPGTATEIIADGFGPLTLLGPLAFGNSNPHTLTLSGTSTYLNTFGGNIPDNATTNTVVVKAAAGTWMLAGSNSFSGGITIQAGSLLITNDYAMGVSTGAVYLVPASGSASMGTIKSISNNVTLGATRTITMGGVNPGSFGVFDTNNLYVASFITGTGAVQKASSSFTLGTVRFSCDTNNYSGDFNVGFGNTEFTSVGNQGTRSSLGVGAASSGGSINILNSTSYGLLRYVGLNNDSTTRPLNWTNTTGNFALDVTNTGSIAYLATRNMRLGTGGACTFFLQGSNTGTNTLAQGINDDNGSTTLVKEGTGRWILTGANTYSGPTTISGGILSVSSDGNLGNDPGSATPNSLTIDEGTLSASAGFTLNANRGIAVGPTGTNTLGANASGIGTIDVASGQTLTYGGIIANNTSTNFGGLVKTSGGTLTLSGVNTYNGDTTISNGVLALSGSGSIASSTNLFINAGGTFDVSGVGGGYTLAGGQVLCASNGATATINGSLNLGPAGLVIGYATGTPTINVTGGALTLASGNAVTVDVAGGTPIGAGSYQLVSSSAGGSVTGTAPTPVTVGGAGLAVGATASLSISNNDLYLVVSGGSAYRPLINSFGFINGKAVLNFSGTNGQTYEILSATNLTTPLTNWTIVNSGTMTGSIISYTNTPGSAPQQFFIIKSQ